MRSECRYCKNKRKEGVFWYDDDYCSGKCKKLDGGDIPSVAAPTRISRAAASFEDYLLDHPKRLGEKDSHGQRIKGRTPKLYRLRFEAEKLNWGEPMSAPELEQGGFRANRKPIPGDWDFEEKESLPPGEGLTPTEQDRKDLEDAAATGFVYAPNEWDLIRKRAKELSIKTHGKKRPQIEAEILDYEALAQENENE